MGSYVFLWLNAMVPHSCDLGYAQRLVEFSILRLPRGHAFLHRWKGDAILQKPQHGTTLEEQWNQVTSVTRLPSWVC